jgi:hypothetical protein
MRTNFILTVTAVAIAGAGASYYFLRDDALPRRQAVAMSSAISTPSVNVKNLPVREERRDQRAGQDRQRLVIMNEKIAALEARLRELESTAGDQAQELTAPSQDEPRANKDAEKAKPKRFSEDDFGQWMDEALNTGDFDRDATRLTMEQMETSLAEVPGIDLADMLCGQRFCRASFVSDNGKRPNVSQLFGASPFIDSGFSINEPDGRVRVYFTQPGQSLSELRSEAQESALREQ